MAVTVGEKPKYRLLLGRILLETLRTAEILPPNCRRCVIDVPFDGAVSVYYDCIGDVRLLDLKLPERLQGMVTVRAKDMPRTEGA